LPYVKDGKQIEGITDPLIYWGRTTGYWYHVFSTPHPSIL